MSLRTTAIIAHLAQKNILLTEDVGEYLSGIGDVGLGEVMSTPAGKKSATTNAFSAP
jgi:hypothetical protein